MQYGASFSHPHLEELGMHPQKAIKEFKSLGFSWIRLGCYWNDIEKVEGKFDFRKLENLIKFCEKNKINVVLTVGMKAPRWPEYYNPNWVNNSDLHIKTLEFIEKCIKCFKKHKCIKVWQIENEPLDPSGPDNKSVDLKLLKDELGLVKNLDKRKIMITFWGNDLINRGLYKKILICKEIDIIGIDLYLKQSKWITKWLPIYFGPSSSLENLKEVTNEIRRKGKEFWITELQAEPWEPNQKLHESDNPPSFSPTDFKRNLDYALSLSPNTILFWGFEYWLSRKLKGDLRYWDEILKLNR